MESLTSALITLINTNYSHSSKTIEFVKLNVYLTPRCQRSGHWLPNTASMKCAAPWKSTQVAFLASVFFLFPLFFFLKFFPHYRSFERVSRPSYDIVVHSSAPTRQIFLRDSPHPPSHTHTFFLTPPVPSGHRPPPLMELNGLKWRLSDSRSDYCKTASSELIFSTSFDASVKFS